MQPTDLAEWARLLGLEPPTAARTAGPAAVREPGRHDQLEGLSLEQAAHQLARGYGFAGARVVVVEDLEDSGAAAD